MANSNLILLREALARAERDPAGFFGHSPDAVLRTYHVSTHPDRFQEESEREQAKEIFNSFTRVRERLMDSVRCGEYRLIYKLAAGDLSTVYVARKDGEDFVVKVPTMKADAEVRREADTVSKIRRAAKGLAGLLPEYRECFTQDGKLCSSQSYLPAYEPLSQIAKRYPGGIDGKHIGWLYRRLCYALYAAHDMGIVNGAITPDHILIDGKTRSILLIGWLHSGKAGDRLRFVPRVWKQLYPASSLASKVLQPELDKMMIAKSLLSVSGKLPLRLQNFLKATSAETATKHATVQTLSVDAQEVLLGCYGSPKFSTLD